MSPKSEFQNLSFCILRRKQCHCWYFTILFALLSVAVAVFFYFLLSIYVTVSRPYRLLEFYPKKASSMSLCNVLCTGIPLKLAIKKSVPRFLYFLFPEKTWGSGNGVIDAGS